jgi:hypothetical protein
MGFGEGQAEPWTDHPPRLSSMSVASELQRDLVASSFGRGALL